MPSFSLNPQVQRRVSIQIDMCLDIVAVSEYLYLDLLEL